MPASRRGRAAAPRPWRSGRRRASPSGRVVQVVELADRGDAGQRHLGVRRRGPARGRCPGRAAPATRVHRARARSRTCRRRRACGRAAPGGTRGSARWRSPGRTTPGSAGRSGRRGSPGVDRGEPPVVDLEATSPRGPPAARRAAVARPSLTVVMPAARSRAREPAHDVVSASTPARQSSRSAYSAGECEIAGRVADEQHRASGSRPRRGCRRRGRRRWPAAGRRPSSADEPLSRRPSVERRSTGVHDSSVHGAAVRPRPASSAPRRRADGVRVTGAAGVEPGRAPATGSR